MIKSCKLDKYFYYANKSNENYLYTLVDSRVGVNLDYPGLKQIATIIKPLLDKGQTIYQILENHKEISQCSKTLYTYIRNILLNKRHLDKLTQEDLNSMFSHINSVPRATLGGKTPYEVFTYFYGDMEMMY